MQPQNAGSLKGRVVEAASRALGAKGWVAAVDVLVGIGWLSPGDLEAWRGGQVPYLEQTLNVGLGEINSAMRAFHAWSEAQGLRPDPVPYVVPNTRRLLQFTKSADPSLEARYSTHWATKAFAEGKQERGEELRGSEADEARSTPAERLPVPGERTVFVPLREARCNACGLDLGRRAFIVLVQRQARCLKCEGLHVLVYLPSGNALLTRRAREGSASHAVVLKWSRARKRYERQGLLVEATALKDAAKELDVQIRMLEDEDGAQAAVIV
jgi:hypothetical protein